MSFEEITGAGGHPEIQLDPLAVMPMSQETAEQLLATLDSLVDDYAFRPDTLAEDKYNGPAKRWCVLETQEPGLAIDVTQERPTRNTPDLPIVRWRAKGVKKAPTTTVEFFEGPDGIVGRKKIFVPRDLGPSPFSDNFEDLRAQYGTGRPATLTAAEQEAVENDIERVEEDTRKTAAVAAEEAALGLDFFSERDAQDLLARLATAEKAGSWQQADQLRVWERRKERVSAEGDESQLVHDEDLALLCAQATARYMDAFMYDTQTYTGMHAERALRAADETAERIIAGWADGQRTLGEIFGSASSEGLEEAGYEIYTHGEYSEREGQPSYEYSNSAMPFPEVQAKFQSDLRMIYNKFGEENVVVVPATDFFGDPVTDYFGKPLKDCVHIYVRRQSDANN